MNKDDSQFAPRPESPANPASQKMDMAIDRAVRRMMHVDPAAGFRRRVMSRIDAPPARRLFLFPAYAAGAAALAILVLAVVVTRDSRLDPAPATPAVAVVADRMLPPDNPVARPTEPVAPQAPARRTVTRRRAGFHSEPIPMPRVADVFGTRTSAVAATADPTTDAVWTTPPAAGVDNNIAAMPVVVRPLDLIPIETHPIVIAPLLAGRLPDGASIPPR